MVDADIDMRRQLPLVTAAMLLAAVGIMESLAHLRAKGPGWDADAYWGAWHGLMYDGSVGSPGQYLYSPAFAQALWPLSQTTWTVFAGALIAANAIGLAWLLRPLSLTVAVSLWLAGSQEVLSGNVFIPMAVAAVIGMRFPHFWAFAALTKVTPCLGPIWFAARGEWPAVLKAAGTTLIVVAASWLTAPELWRDWIGFLMDQWLLAGDPVGYEFIPGPIYRIPAAVVLVVFAARTNRVWLLPVAMLLATPFIWNGAFTLLAAIPRLTASKRLAAPRGRAGGPRAHPRATTA